jgi:hypothetical protein
MNLMELKFLFGITQKFPFLLINQNFYPKQIAKAIVNYL